MDLRGKVRKELFPLVVYGSLNSIFSDFGLSKAVSCSPASHPSKHSTSTCSKPITDSIQEIGGWLRPGKLSKDGSISFGETFYVVLDDSRGCFYLTHNGELCPGAEEIQFHRIVFVLPCEDHHHYSFHIGWLGNKQCKRMAYFSPANTSDFNLVVKWVCALQLRSKTYDVRLDLDREKAVKLALWCQSLYRGFMCRRRLLLDKKKKHRRLSFAASAASPGGGGGGVAASGTISRMVSGLLLKSIQNSDSSDSEEEDDVGESSLALTSHTALNPSTTSATTAATHRMSQLVGTLSKSYFGRSGSNNMAATLRRASITSLHLLPHVASSSSALNTTTTTSSSPATTTTSVAVIEKVDVVEDEIWENQRWQALAMRGNVAYRGWSDAALLPSDRGSFSDRQGLVHFPSLDAIEVPAQWVVKQEWTLDGQVSQCNADGWRYATTFGSLDANLASGRESTCANPRWLVRRRRWFRIRERTLGDNQSSVFAHSGWLGMQGLMTGRWTNHFAFIPLKERTREGDPPSLCYFKDSVPLFDQALDFSFNLLKISKQDARIKALDNACVISDKLATRERPGLFSIHLTGEAEPRVFNAGNSEEARQVWVKLISSLIQSGPTPNYETVNSRRSMRKGAYWELSRATVTVKNAVGEVKTQFKKRSSVDAGNRLHRVESDPDFSEVLHLRKQFQQHGEAQWMNLKRTGRAVSSDPQEEDLGNVSDASGPSKRKSLFSKMPTFKRIPTVGFMSSPPESEGTGNVEVPPPLELPPSATTTTLAMTTTSPEIPIVPFEIPIPFENTLFDSHFDLSVDALDTLLFREEEFSRDLLAFEKMTDIQWDPWTNGISVGSEHRRRYQMPRVGVVPASPSLQLLTRTQSSPGQGYVVEQVVSTPDVPFGNNFTIDFCLVLASSGPNRCRLIVSQRLTILKPFMAQSWAKSGTKQQLVTYFKTLWFPFIRKWLANKNKLVNGESCASTMASVASPAPETVAAVADGVSNNASSMELLEKMDLLMRYLRILVGLLVVVLMLGLYLLYRFHSLETKFVINRECQS